MRMRRSVVVEWGATMVMMVVVGVVFVVRLEGVGASSSLTRWSDALQCAEGGPCAELRDVLDDLLASRACLSLYETGTCDRSCAKSVRAHASRSLWSKCVTRCAWSSAFLDAVLDWATFCESRVASLSAAAAFVGKNAGDSDNNNLMAGDSIADAALADDDPTLAAPIDERAQAVREAVMNNAEIIRARTRDSINSNQGASSSSSSGQEKQQQSHGSTIRFLAFAVVSGAVVVAAVRAASLGVLPNVFTKRAARRKSAPLLSTAKATTQTTAGMNNNNISSSVSTATGINGSALRGARRHIRTDYWNTLDTH